MIKRRTLKLIHLASTAWFMLCMAYILILALRQAGVRWWIIFSLSGHSALLVFLLISLYLFAIFRGVGKSQKIEVEHPLTSTNYYVLFYVTAPFLGGLAGCLGMIGEGAISQFLLGITLGTLGATFLVWVIIDPAIGLLEVFLSPTSRKHYIERRAIAKAQRENRQRERAKLLAEVVKKEELDQQRWQEVLRPQAEKLAELLTTSGTNFKQAERKAIDIGVKAWQMGGLSCMRQLHHIAMTICKQRSKDKNIIDYISIWWDGIGNWRSPSLG